MLFMWENETRGTKYYSIRMHTYFKEIVIINVISTQGLKTEPVGFLDIIQSPFINSQISGTQAI